MNLSLILVTTSHEQDVALRDVRSFFSRLSDGVEILSCRTSSRKRHTAIQNYALQAKGDVIFVLDPWLSIPLAEVLVWLSYLSAHPNVNWLFGNRLKTGFVLNERAQELTNLSHELLQDKALPDPLCSFLAFRAEARSAWQKPLQSKVLLAQELALRTEQVAIQPARSTRQDKIGFWEAIKLRGEIHRLSHPRFSQQT